MVACGGCADCGGRGWKFVTSARPMVVGSTSDRLVGLMRKPCRTCTERAA